MLNARYSMRLKEIVMVKWRIFDEQERESVKGRGKENGVLIQIYRQSAHQHTYSHNHRIQLLI